MIDPEPWALLHNGVVGAIEADGDSTVLSIEIPYVASRFAPSHTSIRLRLTQVEELAYLPSSHEWDEPELVDPAAIVAAAPDISGAAANRHGELVVRGARGKIIARYGDLTIELPTGEPVSLAELRREVRAHWDEYRARWAPESPVHPLVRDVMTGAWSRARLDEMIEAWRQERTSEFADVIEVLDDATRGDPPVRLADLDAFPAWRETWSADPGAAVGELAACAQRTFDVLLDEADFDHGARACASWWAGIAAAVAALHDASPDPRLGRGLEKTLRSPSSSWFRVDQVAHAIGTFPAPNGDPSFADHFFRLLDTHADAGTATRLEEEARIISIEADCNGAEMARRLRQRVIDLRTRYPRDRTLSSDALTALRNREVASSEPGAASE